MSDKPEKVAAIECTVCGALLEIYRRWEAGQVCVDWHSRDTELYRDLPLHRCPQPASKSGVRRRFPGEMT